MKRRTTPVRTGIQALILAGGQGERLRPLTASRPKPAVSFGGTFRIIDFTLSNCFHSGISNVSLLTQYGHEQLLDYVNEGWNDFWITGETGREPLRFLPPSNGRRYRGTADAVFHNSRLLLADTAETVLVLSGDHIYQMDYGDLLSRHMDMSADLTIATIEHPLEEATHFGVVEMAENLRVTGFEEKPANPSPMPSCPSAALVSMGVYLFRKSVLLKSLQEVCGSGLGYDFGHDIIPSLIPAGRTYAYNFRDEVQNCSRYWRDIGTLDGYYETSMDLVAPEPRFDPYANFRTPSQPTRHPVLNVRIRTGQSPTFGRGCEVARTVVSQGVHVGDNAIVMDSVLMPGVQIGKGARLNRTIIEEEVHIPAGYQAGYDRDQDGLHHIVTRNGVVVVSRIPEESRPASVIFQNRGELRQAMPGLRRSS